MKLIDIIALAKQGYTPSDIKELIALGEESHGTGKDEEETEAPGEEPSGGEPQNPEPPETEEPSGEEETQKEQAPDKKEPDYKALYEQERKKRQAENRRRNSMEGQKTDTDDQFLSDIASMY